MSAIFLLALTAATLFAGVALYITLVEHLARLTLDDGPMLAQWQPSYRRALPMQAVLAILGGVSALFVWQQGGDWPWLAGGAFMLANWPFTVLVIMPTNKRLMSINPGRADLRSRDLLRRWGRLHAARSTLGCSAMVLLAWASVRQGRTAPFGSALDRGRSVMRSDRGFGGGCAHAPTSALSPSTRKRRPPLALLATRWG